MAGINALHIPENRRVEGALTMGQEHGQTLNGKTVVVVSARGGLGGPTRSIGAVLAELSGHVHRTLISPKGALASLAGEKGWCDLHVLIPNTVRLHYFTRVVAAFKVGYWVIKNRRKIEVIHANGEAEVALVGLAAFLSRVPLVVSARASEIKPWVRRLRKFWRFLLPNAQWVAVSEFSRKLVVDAGLADSRRVIVIPNAVAVDEVTNERREPSPSSRVRIGFLGGKGFDKGFSLLPDVIQESDPDTISWLIFTSKPNAAAPDYQKETWDRLAALPNALEFVGKLKNVASAYARCDIVFCPSIRESFGRIPVEAMMNAIPIVASDIPTFREFVGDNECGILFPAGDAAAAAKALGELVSSPARRHALGQRGAKRASAYAPSAIAQCFWELYGLPREAGPAPGRCNHL